jgi:hypothetical protein
MKAPVPERVRGKVRQREIAGLACDLWSPIA